MMGHKICFSEDIWPIIPKLSLLLLLIWSPVKYKICPPSPTPLVKVAEKYGGEPMLLIWIPEFNATISLLSLGAVVQN